MRTSLSTLVFSLGTVCVDLSPLILGEHLAHIFAAAAALTDLFHLDHLVSAQPKTFLHSSHAIATAPAAFTLALALSIILLKFTVLLVPGNGRHGQQCHQHDDNNNKFHVRFSINWLIKIMVTHSLLPKFGENVCREIAFKQVNVL
jgi:hypothetical protein